MIDIKETISESNSPEIKGIKKKEDCENISLQETPISKRTKPDKITTKNIDKFAISISKSAKSASSTMVQSSMIENNKPKKSCNKRVKWAQTETIEIKSIKKWLSRNTYLESSEIPNDDHKVKPKMICKCTVY